MNLLQKFPKQKQKCSIQELSCVMKVELITKQLEQFTVMTLQKQELLDANGISKMMLQEFQMHRARYVRNVHNTNKGVVQGYNSSKIQDFEKQTR